MVTQGIANYRNIREASPHIMFVCGSLPIPVEEFHLEFEALRLPPKDVLIIRCHSHMLELAKFAMWVH